MAPMNGTQPSSHEGRSAWSNSSHSAYTNNPLNLATQNTNNRTTLSTNRTPQESPGDSSHAPLDTAGPWSKLGTSKDHGCESPHGDEEAPPGYTTRPASIYQPSSFRPSMIYAQPESGQQDDLPPESSQRYNPASLPGNGSAGNNERISHSAQSRRRSHQGSSLNDVCAGVLKSCSDVCCCPCKTCVACYIYSRLG